MPSSSAHDLLRIPLCPLCLIDVHAPLQCYDRAFLRLYGKLPATPLMLQEDLEQLKARKRQSGLFQLTANAQVTKFGPTAGHGAWVQDVCRGGRPFRTWRGRAGGALPAFPVCYNRCSLMMPCPHRMWRASSAS